jgi:hypothetical protein
MQDNGAISYIIQARGMAIPHDSEKLRHRATELSMTESQLTTSL